MTAPHPAATVLLLREDAGPSRFSVFMVRRSMKSSFMPGAYVFPGGRVDPEDGADAALESVALTDAQARARFSDLVVQTRPYGEGSEASQVAVIEAALGPAKTCAR